eukprot:Hpha_TRINITY_DN24003_c0_g1::TRINITY_DN24003_c0_g1_i1::g.130331::m.130331
MDDSDSEEDNLDLTVEERQLLHAAMRDNHDTAQALLTGGLSLLYTDSGGMSPVLVAVRFKSHRVLRLLLDAGAATTVADKQNRTALWLAAHQADKVAVAELLKCEVNPELPGPEGERPLHCAVISDASGTDVVPLLLSAGADPSAPSGPHGKSAYEVGRESGAQSFPLLAEAVLMRIGRDWDRD